MKLPMHRHRVRAARDIGLIIASGAALAWAVAGLPALAQDNAAAQAQEADPQVLALGMDVWKTKIGCPACHGWSGNGVPDDPRQPVGANLRQTQLDHAGLMEVIKCGRPATGMPHFDARAYKDKRCYGVTEADLGDQVPPSWGTFLIPREVEAVTTYIEARMKGRGPFTFAECEEYYGADAEICRLFELNRGADAPVQEAPAH